VTAGPDRRWLRTVVAVAWLAALLPAVAAIPASPATAATPATPASVRAGSQPSAPVSPARAADGPAAGLTAELTTVTPSAMRPGRPLELRGRVTNADDHVWRQINTYLVISAEPVSTRPDLAAAADSPPETYVGDRVTELGTFDRLGSLAPGEYASFRVEVPWRRLPVSGAPGAYTVGVQVLAYDTDGSRPTAARARTFVPLVDPGGTVPVLLAMVWPLEGPVLRRADGTYARAGRTARTMAPSGRLRRVVDLGRTSGPLRLTVVPDPALLDAAGDLGTGRFGPTGGGTGRNTGGDEEGAEEGAEGGDPPRATAPDAVPVVADWLGDAQDLAAESTPWSTAYGEPWPDALAAPDLPERVPTAIRSATDSAQRRRLGGPARTLQIPHGGVLPPLALPGLRRSDGDQVTVLAPRMLPDWEALDGSAQQVATPEGPWDVVVADPALAEGGPAPGDPVSALQMRQRLLAETALLGAEAAAAGRSSLTATFVAPHAWDPGPYWPVSGFFTGLDVGWLSPVFLDDVVGSPRDYPGPLGLRGRASPSRDSSDEVLQESLVEVSARLHRRARLLVRLVDGGRQLRRWYDAGAALGVSGAARRDGVVRQRLTERSAETVRRELRGVSLTGPEFVTLSSSRGRFPLTVSNGLDRTVTVSVSVVTADGADNRFDAGQTLTIGPGQRDTVTVETRVGEAGITTATAYLLTSDGRRFGVPLSFTVRTTVVGAVIWGVMGVACLVLVFAIARRLVRRVRGRGAEVRIGGSGAEPAP